MKYVDGKFGFTVQDGAEAYVPAITGAMFAQIDDNVVEHDGDFNERSIEVDNITLTHEIRPMKQVAVMSWVSWAGDVQDDGGFEWVPIDEDVVLHEQFEMERERWKENAPDATAKVRFLFVDVPDFGTDDEARHKISAYLDSDGRCESVLPAEDVLFIYASEEGRRVLLQHVIDLKVRMSIEPHQDEVTEIKRWLRDYGPEETFGLSETLVDVFPNAAHEVLDEVMRGDTEKEVWSFGDREVHRAQMRRYMAHLQAEVSGLLHYWTVNHLPGEFLSGPEYPFTESLEEVESRVGHAAEALSHPLIVRDPILRIWDGMTDAEIDQAVAEAEKVDGLGRWHYAGQPPGAACGAGEDVLTTGDDSKVTCTACKRLLQEDEDAPYVGELGPFTKLVDAIDHGEPVTDFEGGEGGILLLVRLGEHYTLGVSDYTSEHWDVFLYIDREDTEGEISLDVTESMGKVDASEEQQPEIGRRIRHYLTTEQFSIDKETLRVKKESK